MYVQLITHYYVKQRKKKWKQGSLSAIYTVNAFDIDTMYSMYFCSVAIYSDV